MTMVRIPLLLIAAILSASCLSEPSLDKAKFSGLDRTARNLRAAPGGDWCSLPDSVVQQLSADVAALRGKSLSQPDRALLSAYGNLAVMAADLRLLCRSRSQLAAFGIIPRGRIYVNQEIDPVVERYGLATERHRYPATGAYLKSISADAIKMINDRMQDELKKIDVLLKYN